MSYPKGGTMNERPILCECCQFEFADWNEFDDHEEPVCPGELVRLRRIEERYSRLLSRLGIAERN